MNSPIAVILFRHPVPIILHVPSRVQAIFKLEHFVKRIEAIAMDLMNSVFLKGFTTKCWAHHCVVMEIFE